MAGRSTCISHSPDARERGFGGAQPGSGPKPQPKAIDELRRRIETDVDKWLAPFERALQHDDPAVGMRAVVEVMDRVFGKPKQTTETQLSGSVTIEALFAGDPLAGTDSEMSE